MKQAKTCTIRSVFLVAFCLLLLPSPAMAETKQRTCGSNPGKTLQHFLDELNPGDTLIVSGTCNENVVIGEGHRNLTIDGQGTATINGSGNMNAPTVMVRGRGIAIKGFTILGGLQGVQFVRGGTGTVDSNRITGAVAHGVAVHLNSFAQIVGNIIENNGFNGICVCEHSTADIGFRGDFATQGSANTIRSNGNNGILVSDASYAEIESNLVTGNTGNGIAVDEGSSAKIGSISGIVGTYAGTNKIEFNGNRGVQVSRSSTARIVGNSIKSNRMDGVGVHRASQADIASNQIDNNLRDGINVYLNSGVNLGNDSGLTPQDVPNQTTTNNARYGIVCSINSSADGRLGTLNGGNASQYFDTTCVNSLILIP